MRMVGNSKKRYELDAIGHLYASTISERYNPIFRIQVNLTDAIDAALLQQAVDDLRDRYPYLYVGMKKGVVSYYFEESDEQLRVVYEQTAPLQTMNREDIGQFCMRILYGDRYIALEVVHVLTDGYGAKTYLIALLHRYLELRHKGQTSPVCSPKKELLNEETEDAYEKYAVQTVKRPKQEMVFRQDGTPVSESQKTMTVMTIPTEDLLEKAHSYGVSVTTLITTVLADSLVQMQQRTVEESEKRRVAIGVAVDSRKLLASQTMRNFSIEIALGLVPDQMNLRFDEKCQEIDRQLKERTKKEYLQNMVSEYVEGMRNPVVKCIPLIIKDRLIDHIYAKTSVERACTCLSNLGNIDLPDDVTPYVHNVYFAMGAERILPNNCCVVSYKGNTNICFTRTIEESTLEDEFFHRLQEMGVEKIQIVRTENYG